MARAIRCATPRLGLCAPALLWAIACGSQDPVDDAPAAQAPPTLEAPLPGPRSARIEYANGRVSVLSNGAQRVAVLEQLAERAGFELLAGSLKPQPLTLRIEDVPLASALARLLEGVPYALEFGVDATTGLHAITSLSVGETIAVDEPATVAAAPVPRDEPQQPQREPEEALKESAGAQKGQGLLAVLRAHGVATSTEERQRLLREREARAEAMEPELIEQLHDDDPGVRADAVSELPLGGEEGEATERFQRVARALADDPHPRVRVAAAERLGEVESPEAVDSLGLGLSDPDREVVLAAIDALEDTEDARAIPYLEPLLDDPDEDIRDAAAFAIEYLEW